MREISSTLLLKSKACKHQCFTIMDPAEVEFLAEKEMVSVVPNFSQDTIYLIGVSSLLIISKETCFCLQRTSVSEISIIQIEYHYDYHYGILFYTSSCYIL